MNITVQKEAVDWYKREMGIKEGDSVRFFARYGGFGNLQSGFSLGISKDQPSNPGSTASVEGVNFFIEHDDLWYFDGHDLIVSYNEKLNEPEFSYQK